MSTKKTAVAKRPVQLKIRTNGKAKVLVSKEAKPKATVVSASARPTNSKASPVKTIPVKPLSVKPVSLAKAAPPKGFEIPKPLPPKKEEIFNTGDKVVYPAHGVGAVDSIQARIIGGSETKFYMITIMETGMKVMVPVSQAQTVGLRKIVDVKTVEKVYGILKDKDVTVQQQTWNRRYREYTQKLKTGSVFEIATVIRDLSVLKGDKELSFGERKMLDTAQGLLVKEISIAKARPEDLIRAELQKICDL